MKENLTTPYYLLEETLLRRNLALIKRIADEAGVEFILAFKAYALWRTFPIFREYINHTTASSPYEAQLAYEEFGSKVHTYSPAYEEATFGDIVRYSSHITFNSLTQYVRFHERATAGGASIGLRVNPEYSEIATALYDPCAPGSRFGVLADDLPKDLPADVEGFHVHCHCESPASALVHTLEHVEAKFGHWLPRLKWLNLGGGHLVTREGYDISLLISTLQEFRHRYPNLRIILEPGSAFAWQTGTLVASVVDIVENHSIRTAILNVSFTCHMPDCLEMPYQPAVRVAQAQTQTQTQAPPQPSPEGEGVRGDSAGVCNSTAIVCGSLAAKQVSPSGGDLEGASVGATIYRLGGNSCLSGDFMGFWQFPRPLSIGDEIIFEDMIHYTTVKTTMFNGIHHPSLVLHRADGCYELLRRFTYEDYRDRMD